MRLERPYFSVQASRSVAHRLLVHVHRPASFLFVRAQGTARFALVVDAAEGPKPQTRFVLKKAIANGLKVLVVLNKIDKPQARPDHVIDKTFDLFCELGASDEQTDFSTVYTSAINRIAGSDILEFLDNNPGAFIWMRDTLLVE